MLASYLSPVEIGSNVRKLILDFILEAHCSQGLMLMFISTNHAQGLGHFKF